MERTEPTVSVYVYLKDLMKIHDGVEYPENWYDSPMFIAADKWNPLVQVNISIPYFINMVLHIKKLEDAKDDLPF